MLSLAPSILSADFSNLGKAISEIENGGADMVHLDVMDGHFVPNITIGPPVIEKLRETTKLPFDVHLMIENPDRYLLDFIKAGANIITVHQESCKHLHRTIYEIRNHGIKAGVALNPATPISTIKHVLRDVDMVLIMTVNPGFGGQSLIKNMREKVEGIKKSIFHQSLNIDIQVDGGLKLENLEDVMGWGANVFVVGSAIFESKNINQTMLSFKKHMVDYEGR